MTCTFTYDTNTDIGKVRREIGDYIDAAITPGSGIKPNGANFCDEDVDYYLTINDGSIIGAALNLLMVVATEYSTKATEVELGPYRESYKDQLINLRRQIAMMERRYDSEKASNPRNKISIFRTTQLGIDVA